MSKFTLCFLMFMSVEILFFLSGTYIMAWFFGFKYSVYACGFMILATGGLFRMIVESMRSAKKVK